MWNDQTYYRLYPYQIEAYDCMNTARFWFLVIPAGGGKSVISAAIAENCLATNPSVRRAIIVVPQTMIGKSHEAHRFLRPRDNKPVDWIAHNLTDSNQSDGSKAEEIRRFLRRPLPGIGLTDLVLTCTTAAFVKAFDGCDKKERHKLFDNILLIIDEAHHLMYDESSLEDTNRLGEIVKFAVGSTATHVGIMTATSRRGDGAELLPEDEMLKFKKFKLGYPEFFDHVHPFRLFRYHFVIYGGTYVDTLTNFFKGPENQNRHSLIYLPPVKSRYSVGHKKEDWKACYRAISGGDECPIIEYEGDSIIRIWNSGWNRWVRVANLVNDEVDREPIKKSIQVSHEAEECDIDVILTLNMVKEGANWGWADRIFIIGPRNSSTDHEQTVGRLLRLPERHKDYVKDVDVYHFFARELHEFPDDVKRDIGVQCNRYLNSLFMLMLLDLNFNPVVIRVKRRGPNGEEVEVERKLDLADMLGSDDRVVKLRDSVIQKFTAWMHKHQHDEGKRHDNRKAAMKRIVQGEMARYGKEEHTDEAFIVIWRMFQRQTMLHTGIAITDDMTLDICQENPLGFIMEAAVDFHGQTMTWKQLRKLLTDRVDESLNKYWDFETAHTWVIAHPELCSTYRKYGDAYQSGRLPGELPSSIDVYSRHPKWKGRKKFLTG
jgi:superfamily II DNA or RNA helicase